MEVGGGKAKNKGIASQGRAQSSKSPDHAKKGGAGRRGGSRLLYTKNL